MCFQGVVPAGDGFKLSRAALDALTTIAGGRPAVIKNYIIGRDLVQRRSEKYIIDAFGYDENELAAAFPEVYQHLLAYVFDERRQNPRETYRDKWWIFAEPRPALRAGIATLPRYIGTPYTAKHRPFFFITADTIPDAMVYVVPSDDAFILGVLSCRVHTVFALRAGGSLENRPRYNSKKTFFPFPFPVSAAVGVQEIAEKLDSHRWRQLAAHDDLTVTDMYNVLEKLRSGEALTEKEKVIHEQGLVSVLKQIHDDLDAAVFDAYGWPHDLTDEQILERLVALNAERAEEERRGIIRWLRPEFQNPAGAKSEQQTTMAGIEIEEKEAEAKPKAAIPWPKDLPSQIAAVRDLITTNPTETWTLDRTAKAFKGAKRTQVQSVLDSLAALGLLVTFTEGTVREWRAEALP